jgi:hypothetical protein
MSGSSGTETAPGADNEGRRLAMVVAVTDYVDASLRRLRAPAGDAAELRDLLADPEIGGFSVTSVINEKAQQIRLAIEEFLSDRLPDDLLLVYLSCHGLVDPRRRLYFAARDTIKNRLASSGIESHWLLDQLEDCRARRQVVILDCCFSGAFAQGSKGDDDLGIGQRLVGPGRGRVVLTASRATEYSFEGEPLHGEDTTRGSVFTGALIEGIRTGRADADHDGDISVDDAYAYAFEQVRGSGTQQTPQRWLYGAEGSILLARAPSRADRPAPPAEPLTRSEPVPLPSSDPAPAGADPLAAPPTAERPPPGGSTRLGARGAAYAAAAALLSVAAVVTVVLLARDPGGSADEGPGSDGTSGTANHFTARAPWRLRIDDQRAGAPCHVDLTSKTNARTWDGLYGTRTYQMQDSGTFRYQTNDPGCHVTPLNGDGGTQEFPISASRGEGDTHVFKSPGAVSVDPSNCSSSVCTLTLMSAANGQGLEKKEVPEDAGPVKLHSGRPARVYIADPSCDILITPAH